MRITWHFGNAGLHDDVTGFKQDLGNADEHDDVTGFQQDLCNADEHEYVGDLLVQGVHDRRHQALKSSPREELSHHRLKATSADELKAGNILNVQVFFLIASKIKLNLHGIVIGTLKMKIKPA